MHPHVLAAHDSLSVDLVMLGVGHQAFGAVMLRCACIHTRLQMLYNCAQDEAFQLWTEDWASLYEKSSRSYKIIQDIVDHWYLVSVVENDYVRGDLFKTLLGTKNKDDQVEEVAAAWNPASQHQEPKEAAAAQ